MGRHSNGARSCCTRLAWKSSILAPESRTLSDGWFRWADVSSLAAGNSGGAAAARRIQAPSGLAQSPQIRRGLPLTIARNRLCVAFFVRRRQPRIAGSRLGAANPVLTEPLGCAFSSPRSDTRNGRPWPTATAAISPLGDFPGLPEPEGEFVDCDCGSDAGCLAAMARRSREDGSTAGGKAFPGLGFRDCDVFAATFACAG